MTTGNKLVIPPWCYRVARSKCVRPIVQFLVRAINASLRANPLQRYRPRAMRLDYLNAGCGSSCHPAFINLDADYHRGVDLVHDLAKPLPLDSGSLQGIFTEHCLEHLPFQAVTSVTLPEFRRTLRSGGVLRIVVPDAEVYFHQCLGSKKATQGEPPKQSPAADTPMMQLNRIFREFGHQYAYDFDTLEVLLRASGFTNIVKESYAHGRDPRLLIDQVERAHESLYVEASAP